MRVAQVWRYPVKSMQGESLHSLDIGLDRVAGDREWGVRDSSTGIVLTGRTAQPLLHAAARLDGEGVRIQLPDGRELRDGDENADLALSSYVGSPVHLAHAKSDEQAAFEAPVEFSDDPSPVARWRSRPGSFNDGHPVHILTTASLRAAAALYPAGEWEVRRFRPNVLVETDGEAFVEDDWTGLRIGDVELEIYKRTTRCVMTARAQPGIDDDLEVPRTLARNRKAKLGVYARVKVAGTIAAGDERPYRMIVLSTATATVAIDPAAGGRVASIIVEGLELLVTFGPSSTEWGCFVMAPFAGRIRNGRFSFKGEEHQLPRNLAPHAIHGTVFDRPWHVEDSDDRRALLSCDLGADWPFAGRVAHEIVLTDDALELRLEVATEDHPFPAACGWHPWWRRRLSRGGPAELDVDAESMWVRGADGIPTGDLVSPPTPGPWDDCLTDLRRPPVLRWDGALELTVETSCDDVVVYDQPTHAVCIEPQTGPPDSLRLTPVLVEAGWPLIAEAAFRWRML